MRTHHLTLKIFALIIINDLGDVIAQLMMKTGLVHTGITSVTMQNFTDFALRSASSGLIWAGVCVYLVNFFVWIVILYKVDLSIAMPVGSTSYILVPFAAILFLHEHVSMMRWLGIVCIVLGIHFVSQSKKDPKKVPVQP